MIQKEKNEQQSAENLKDKKTGNDLGTGSVGKLLLKLAAPAILAQVVNMLYNIVDRMYIGHIPEIGVSALTGVGLCFPIIILITAFSSLIGMGGAPRAAIFMGKREKEKAEEILGNCVTALVVIAILLTIVFLVFGRPLLILFGASENTIGYALDYMQIYVCGTIFVQMALGLNSFITTQGFSLISMMTVAIGAVTNIVLDPILIFGFQMGVQGAALATIISQAVSSVWVLRFLTGKKTKLRIQKKYLRVRAGILLPVLGLGVSPFVMQSTESLLNICLNASLSRYGGDLAVGAMTIMSSVMQICTLPLQGLTQGAQPIISFNFGAGKVDRIKKAFRLAITAGLTYTTAFWILLMVIPQVFVMIFNSSSTELMDFTVWSMRIYMAGLFALGAQITCQQTFLALGQAKVSLILACLRKLILLIPLILVLPLFMEDKVFGVFVAEPIADILASLTTVIVFSRIFPKLLRGVHPGKEEK